MGIYRKNPTKYLSNQLMFNIEKIIMLTLYAISYCTFMLVIFGILIFFKLYILDLLMNRATLQWEWHIHLKVWLADEWNLEKKLISLSNYFQGLRNMNIDVATTRYVLGNLLKKCILVNIRQFHVIFISTMTYWILWDNEPLSYIINIS